MDDFESIRSVADNLTTLGLLVIIAMALVRGWVIPVGRLHDWQHYASQAEERAKLAEQALSANNTELSKLNNTLETTNRHIGDLTKAWHGERRG